MVSFSGSACCYFCLSTTVLAFATLSCVGNFDYIGLRGNLSSNVLDSVNVSEERFLLETCETFWYGKLDFRSASNCHACNRTTSVKTRK